MAGGQLHFARYGGRIRPWDHAAGVLLHREAGGFSAFTDGRSPSQQSCRIYGYGDQCLGPLYPRKQTFLKVTISVR